MQVQRSILQSLGTASSHHLHSSWNHLFDMQKRNGLDSAIRDRAVQAMNAQAERSYRASVSWRMHPLYLPKSSKQLSFYSPVLHKYGICCSVSFRLVLLGCHELWIEWTRPSVVLVRANATALESVLLQQLIFVKGTLNYKSPFCFLDFWYKHHD